jgi:hypothetical protein
MFIALTFIFLLDKIGVLRTLVACGIALGIFGSGVLYWETVATDLDIRSVGREITRLGASTKLSVVDISYVIAFAGLGFIAFYLHSGEMVLFAKQKANLGLHTALLIGVVAVVYACPAFGVYVQAKLMRRLCSRWTERIRVSEETEIKRILRVIGFASLFLSGIAQLPAAFFNQH